MSALFQFNLLSAYPFPNTIGSARIPASDPFYGKGGDFLAPNFIGRTVSNVQLGSGITYLGKNPSAKTVLNGTNGQVDALLAGGPIGAIPADIKLYNDAAIPGMVPDIGVNPGAMRILGNTAFFQDVLTTPGYAFGGYPSYGMSPWSLNAMPYWDGAVPASYGMGAGYGFAGGGASQWIPFCGQIMG
ncbi:MAG: hypothetical protein IPK79_07670 [Vampirovibrionales bacterium]|nr:hypothetical protein [Vampirovibrionales bacterium]